MRIPRFPLWPGSGFSLVALLLCLASGCSSSEADTLDTGAAPAETTETPETAPEPEPEPAPEPEGEATGEDQSEPEDAPPPPPLDSYMGRDIARTMHWRGADWLLRATREDEEHATRMLGALGIEKGDSVCDFGCGNGYHSLPMSELVGEEGRVLGVDLQPEMLGMLLRRARKRGITNIEAVQAESHRSNLEPNSCDLVLMVDVYHELSHPVQVLAEVRAALRPGGELVLVEFREEDPEVPIRPLHKMSKAQIRKEMEANGFEWSGSFDELPWQHLERFKVKSDD